MPVIDVVVIGAGQSGLSAARALQAHGIRPVVLEAGPEPVGSWPHYYDSLTVFSPAGYSSMPGLDFPGDPGHYPHRDEVASYLRRYAAGLGADIRTSTPVTAVEAHHQSGVPGAYRHRADPARCGCRGRDWVVRPSLRAGRARPGPVHWAAAARSQLPQPPPPRRRARRRGRCGQLRGPGRLRASSGGHGNPGRPVTRSPSTRSAAAARTCTTG